MNYFIPFQKYHEKIWLNHENNIKISEFKSNLGDNPWIATNNENWLIKQQYDYIYSMGSSLFIDPRNSTYRDEYIMNNLLTIPKYFWDDNRSFDTMFVHYKSSSTFMILDASGSYGVPIGIDKRHRQVILNDRTRMVWTTFKINMKNNKIIKYQNLDFQGIEYKLTQDILDRHYQPPAQQIVRLDLTKERRSKILTYMIGQYLLIDYGADQYLPIYVLSPTITQTNHHIVHIEDIDEYTIQQTGAQISKSIVGNGETYTTLMVENCKLDLGWDLEMKEKEPNRHQLDNIQQSGANGITDPMTADIVSTAVLKAMEHKIDNDQFNQHFTHLSQQQPSHQDHQPQNQQQSQSPPIQQQQHQMQQSNQARSVPSSPQMIPTINIEQPPRIFLDLI